MLNIFEFFHDKEIVGSWLIHVISFHESSSMSFNLYNKTKLEPASFSYFFELLWEKK